MSTYLKKLSTKSSQVSQTTHTIAHSFFDTVQHDPNNTSFWSKNQIMVDGKKINIMNGFFFYKKSKKRYGELKPIFVSVYKNYLLCSKTKEGISKQYKSVDMSQNFLTLEKIATSSNKYGAGIQLSYNQKQIELFTKTAEDLNVFLYQFKKNFIQVNFEDMYNLDKKLGSGSYADVYRVKDKLTRRDYAAKFFDISSMKNVDRSKQALKNEITIHRQLEHGNIVRLHEIYESSTHIIIIMEYAKGERLIDYVIQRAPLPEKEAMSIIKELLEAVLYLHSFSIIHRDIKLENIIIHKEKAENERISVKLVDFGLSVTVDNIEFFKRSGTPGYVAPEILIAETYDTQVDVFSSGVILFTMLSGKSPFIGPDRAAVLKLNKRCDYSFKPKYWDNKSANAKDLVKKMMEADPDKRLTIQEALSHRCFSTFNIGGFHSLKTLPRDLLSKKSLSNSNEGSRVPTMGDDIEKPKPTPDTRTAANRVPHRTQKESQYQPNRSNSVKPAATVSSSLTKKNTYVSKKSNLLQIPQSRPALGSMDEEEKSELDTPYDRINKASLQTFYKLNSDVASASGDDPHSHNEFQEVLHPSIGQFAENDMIPTEYPDINKKIQPLSGADKSLKSPFRLNSRSYEPSPTSGREDASKQKSCDLTYDLEEEHSLRVPIQPTVFKASMNYIKKTSRMVDE